MNHLTRQQLQIVNHLSFANERLAQVLRDMSDPALEADDVNDSVGSLDGLADYLQQTARECGRLLEDLIHDTTGVES
ncbi:hypothetical protein JS528_11200 [Bifidobacterium sp. MA2]|uniref:Uncharacterized protein n=1 Tax=Bifidobacterium santillanense TaxID=2809028 RepID=A0ABS5USS4_9BIFI|nr:hypothetical protein [Bifidobacterium santillanense]MBT1173885.1 hypothetical protein [Bifidobacterium santillanense]